ncbi:MAG: ATP-dependent DNA helicase [Pseudomonadota bacterium]
MSGVELLVQNGGLARLLDGYEARPSQLEMARAVEAALREPGQRLLVEAGTGVGKSLAYLAPALASGATVVVATGTKALQDQLATRDAPLVAAALVDAGVPEPRIEVVKGRQNYLCLLRMERAMVQGTLPLSVDDDWIEGIARWSTSTVTGDRAELDGLPESWEPWHELDAGADTCVGKKCPHHAPCFVTRLRARAREAQLIITNHHLLLADAALRLSQRFGEVPDSAELLPGHEALIVDEAHGIPEVATDAFGASVSTAAIEHLARDLRQWLTGQAQDSQRTLAPEIDRVEQRLRQLLRDLGGGEDRRVLGPESLGPTTGADLQRGLDGLATLSATLADAADEDPVAQGLCLRAQRLARSLEFVATAGDPTYVYYTEQRRRHVRAVAAPVDVARPLAESLFLPARTVVLTSATLATDQGFGSFRRLVGLKDDPAVVECILPSPFDYASLVRYYLPEPPIIPDSGDHLERLASEIRLLCEASGGGAFLLFTSYRVLEETHRRLGPVLTGTVLRQGDAPRHTLVQRFRDDGNAVLFGTHSFWQGIDVRGAALRLVAIDRLPFASPADPLHAARSRLLEERGERPFTTLTLPQAILDLKQGVGRLVRSSTDGGVIALLDGRLRSKSYGHRFLRALPKAPVLRHIDEVRSFFSS